MFLRPPEPLQSMMMLLGCGSSGGGVVAPSAPETPTGFTATAGDQEIELTWDAQPEADAFEIHYGTTDVIGAASVLTTTATGTGFTFDSTDSIQVGEKYYFWIKARIGLGDSSFSSGVTARSYVTVANSGSVALQVPSPGAINLNDLLFRSGGTVPMGINISWGSELFSAAGDGTWEDDINGGPANPSITGAFTVTNNTGSAFTFWDTEP